MRISDWSSDVCSSDLIWTRYGAPTRLPSIHHTESSTASCITRPSRRYLRALAMTASLSVPITRPRVRSCAALLLTGSPSPAQATGASPPARRRCRPPRSPPYGHPAARRPDPPPSPPPPPPPEPPPPP